MRKKISKALTSGVAFLSLSTAAFADFANPLELVTGGGIKTAAAGTADTLIVNILDWMIGLAALVCVVMLIAAGYSYMTAGGDEGKVGKATKTLTNAIIGLVICFVAVMLVNFVLANFLKTTS